MSFFWFHRFDQFTNEKNENIYGIFLCEVPKMIICIWIQQSYFGRKQKYLWKHFYTVKKPLKNRAKGRNPGKKSLVFVEI